MSKLSSIILFIFILSLSCNDSDGKSSNEEIIEENEVPDVIPSNFRDITSMELVADMKPGWNLGNSLDAEGADETVWGNPIITEELISAIKARGFGTLRVPVTWRFHTGDTPNFTIEEAWLDRVEEVVKYGLDNDMYVILNIHHDEHWIIPTYEQADAVKDRLNKNWTQIAQKFKDYSDYLIFETLNEPRYEGQPEEWTGTPEWKDVINQYHKTSLDAIRATGGNNELRHIMISSYAASQGAINDLIIPNNDERTIVSIHNYHPFNFALTGSDTTWGTQQDKTELDAIFDELYNKFIVNGKPVIMGEWASINRSNTSDRLAHAQYYANGCLAKQILPVWWDNGNNDEYALIDRNTLQWNFPQIADAITSATGN